jgi:hypothetical protein
MIHAYRAELVKLLRRRVLVVTAIASAIVAVGGAAIELASAKPAADAGFGRGLSLERLATAGGGTLVFRGAASFAGTFLFVVFVGLVAAEFSRGSMRTMLLREPRRVRLLAGKLAALLTFAGVALAGTEVVTWVAARVLAPGQHVATSAWTSWAGAGAALSDFGAVMLWVTGYAVLATCVAVLLRSVPLALAVGIAWAGPFEHLVENAWATARSIFPGLLLEVFVAGGSPEVGAGRALATVAGYALVAAIVASAVFARRDVTA